GRNSHGGDARTGDTALLWDRKSQLAGFAVCHWGPASEAGQGCCFAKFAAVRPGPGAGERFGRLLDVCAMLARQAGMPNVLAGVYSPPQAPFPPMPAPPSPPTI